MPFINIFQHLQYWSEELISPLLDSPVTQKKSSTFLKLYFWRLFFRKQTHYSALSGKQEQWVDFLCHKGKQGTKDVSANNLHLNFISLRELSGGLSHEQGFGVKQIRPLHLPPYHSKVTFIYIRESFRNHLDLWVNFKPTKVWLVESLLSCTPSCLLLSLILLLLGDSRFIELKSLLFFPNDWSWYLIS